MSLKHLNKWQVVVVSEDVLLINYLNESFDNQKYKFVFMDNPELIYSFCIQKDAVIALIVDGDQHPFDFYSLNKQIIQDMSAPPMLIMTGQYSLGLLRIAKDCKFQEFIAKPLSRSGLQALFRRGEHGRSLQKQDGQITM